MMNSNSSFGPITRRRAGCTSPTEVLASAIGGDLPLRRRDRSRRDRDSLVRPAPRCLDRNDPVLPGMDTPA